MTACRVILLPGSVLPAGPAYTALVAALGPDVDAVPKDLELYATAEPPPEYDLGHEVAGVLREADARGWERFHLAGYSGGGAAAIKFSAVHPERLWSLALLEPAWAGRWDITPPEQALWRAYERIEQLPPEQFMKAFMRLGVKAGVALPEPVAGDQPAWMAKRPAGIRAFLRAFGRDDIDPDALRRFTRPVYFALGGLSNPDEYGEIATRLGRVYPDFELEVFEQRHHFDPPHRIEPDRLADSLRAFWRRAQTPYNIVG